MSCKMEQNELLIVVVSPTSRQFDSVDRKWSLHLNCKFHDHTLFYLCYAVCNANEIKEFPGKVARAGIVNVNCPKFSEITYFHKAIFLKSVTFSLTGSYYSHAKPRLM